MDHPRDLDQKFIQTLDLMFGRRLRNANLEGIPQVRVQVEHTPELFSFLDQHGILLATLELQGTTVIVRNLKRQNDSKPEVVGDNGPVVQENSDFDDYVCIWCNVNIGGEHKRNCRYAGLVEWVQC